MRELYCCYASLWILYFERGYYERKKRKLQRVCCRLYPFICWIIKRKDLEVSLVDVAHNGWTTHMCVSIVLCIFYVLFPHLFYFIASWSCFSNTELVKLCSSQDLIICNGVMKWPNYNQMTCIHELGSSFIDYVISNTHVSNQISTFNFLMTMNPTLIINL